KIRSAWRRRFISPAEGGAPPSASAQAALYAWYSACRHSPQGRWPAAKATASSWRPRKRRAQVIQRLPAWKRTISRPSWRTPRLPVQAPRSGVATISPVGVMRFRSGISERFSDIDAGFTLPKGLQGVPPSRGARRPGRGQEGRRRGGGRVGEGPGRGGRGTASVRAPAAGARPSRASRGGPGRLWPPRDARDVTLPAGSGEVRDASGGKSTETWPSQTRDQGSGPLQGTKSRAVDFDHARAGSKSTARFPTPE